MTRPQYKKFALALLLYTILVILWGAWVRISHSGDGCGDTWPLCHGQLIPEAERGKTWVEYGHRLTSGIFGLVVVYFYFVAKKNYEKGHFARGAALATLIFTITEALLGAKLVLFGLVTTNDTPYRAFIMALHQVNSFMLTGSVALAAASSLREEGEPLKALHPRALRLFPWLLVIIAVTGAWASLSNSLFPSIGLWEGLREDFSSESHFLLKLRGLHPLIALLGGGSLALFFWIQSQTTSSQPMQKKSLHMALLLIVGLLFGIGTLIFHAPVWMKILHLTLAHAIWVTLLQWLYFAKTRGPRHPPNSVADRPALRT